LCRASYVALDGEGAFRYGGRWNRAGTAVVYATSTLALAALEYLVHVNPEDAPTDLVALELAIPDVALDTWDIAQLPPMWRDAVPPLACQQRGDAWVAAGTSLGVWVPSVVIPPEHNLLLNPAHSAMVDVRVLSEAPFTYDPRLLYRAGMP